MIEVSKQKRMNAREARWELEKFIKACIAVAKDDLREEKELLRLADRAPRPTH